MNRTIVKLLAVAMLALVVGAFVMPKNVHAGTETDVAIAEISDDASVVDSKSNAAALVIAVVAGAGAISMGLVIWKTIEGIARQPEAEGKIRTAMMLGLVFVETAIIYALIVAILIIFVL